ncbi:DUF2148 domain-containing protein [Parabacteroides sp. OttesenSCG-928-G06]|nr:DUF2148 domain-containing protein [Parabacteroides sp. OttesenSCG-928-K15]MDL2282624.1 DUF2148 domain-containing protein [Parabacteroides sp. OttesenSCG-928-G06]
MITNERDIREDLVMDAARRMMTAARTAPKGKGVDIIEMALVTGKDIESLSVKMRQISEETGMKFLLRDADNLESANAVMIIGTIQKVQGLNCAHCGYATCEAKPEAIPCAINSIDLGIAIGSACAMAADMRVDTRVMFSAGWAAQQLNMLGEAKSVMAIPISAGSKNPFFDRKPKEEVK